MASITLRTVWLSLASDLSQTLMLPFVTAITPQPQTPAEIAPYGDGRYRMKRTGTTQRAQTIAAQAVTPAEYALLMAWNTETVLYRDDAGVKFFGAYIDPQCPRHQYDKNCDVSFTVRELTYSEVV